LTSAPKHHEPATCTVPPPTEKRRSQARNLPGEARNLVDVSASAEEREDDVEVPAATRKVERCPPVRPRLHQVSLKWQVRAYALP
jgi:hypothetical protein